MQSISYCNRKTSVQQQRDSENYPGAEGDFSRREEMRKVGSQAFRLLPESVVVTQWIAGAFAELPAVRAGPWALAKLETALWDATET